MSRLVSEAIAADMSEQEKRIVNWVAERQEIKVNETVKLLGIGWQTARETLFGLCRKRILQYIRFQPFEKNTRDSRAFFRLRSTDPIPEGGFEQTIDTI